ncbi:MAG: TIGR04282 family arsenosugar biosynthesis glycosyltransferase [Lentisphaeraceae bacterium]|nr:TIGR04282 family arsenosugar biosynthesis glycosyltransferase [Lentisphaeraceae bacterium]
MKVFIYCRYPELGKVKTRIARECGDVIALALYEKMLDAVFENVKNSSYPFEVHYTGCDKASVDTWLKGVESKKQISGSLGEKLKHSVSEWFESSDEAIVIVGSDQLEIDQSVLEETEENLKKNDVVLGPAEDGGYYLIAMNKAYLQLFDGINWGTETVLEETQNKILESGLSYYLLNEKNDIDYLKDVPAEWKKELRLHENDN